MAELREVPPRRCLQENARGVVAEPGPPGVRAACRSVVDSPSMAPALCSVSPPRLPSWSGPDMPARSSPWSAVAQRLAAAAPSTCCAACGAERRWWHPSTSGAAGVGLCPGRAWRVFSVGPTNSQPRYRPRRRRHFRKEWRLSVGRVSIAFSPGVRDPESYRAPGARVRCSARGQEPRPSFLRSSEAIRFVRLYIDGLGHQRRLVADTLTQANAARRRDRHLPVSAAVPPARKSGLPG